MAVTSAACNFSPNYRAVKRCDVIDRPCILLNQAEDVGTAKQLQMSLPGCWARAIEI